MKRRHVSVSKLAGILGTSRAAISRVLGEDNTSITLTTLSRTATALGCKVRLEIVAA
jgi:transcriptional regulator with XRE-family HTH domain